MLIIFGISPGLLSTITNVAFLAISLLVGAALQYTLLWQAERQESPILADIVDTASLSLSALILSVPGSLYELRKNSKTFSTVVILLCSSYILIVKTILPKYYIGVELPSVYQGSSNITTNFKICDNIDWGNDKKCYTSGPSDSAEMQGYPTRADIFYSMINTGEYNNFKMVQDTTTKGYAVIGISENIGSIAFQALGLTTTVSCSNVTSSNRYNVTYIDNGSVNINGTNAVEPGSFLVGSVPSLRFIWANASSFIPEAYNTYTTNFSCTALYFIAFANSTILDGELLTGTSRFELAECRFDLTIASVTVDQNSVEIVPTSADVINMTTFGILALIGIGTFEMSTSFMSNVFYAPNLTTTTQSLENQFSRQYLSWATALGLYGDEEPFPVQFYTMINSTLVEDDGVFIAATTFGITAISIVIILSLLVQRRMVLASKTERVGRELFTWWGVIRAYSNELNHGDWATDNEATFRMKIRKAGVVL